jgi:hypothetical protein
MQEISLGRRLLYQLKNSGVACVDFERENLGEHYLCANEHSAFKVIMFSSISIHVTLIISNNRFSEVQLYTFIIFLSLHLQFSNSHSSRDKRERDGRKINENEC